MFIDSVLFHFTGVTSVETSVILGTTGEEIRVAETFLGRYIGVLATLARQEKHIVDHQPEKVEAHREAIELIRVHREAIE